MQPPIIDAPFFGFHPGLGCIFTSEGSGAVDKISVLKFFSNPIFAFSSKKEKPPDASRTKRLAMKKQ